jgi:hypothetical protein
MKVPGSPLRKFIEKLEAIENEMGSHPTLEGTLYFWTDDDDDGLELESVEPNRNWGCHCCLGAIVNLKKK